MAEVGRNVRRAVWVQVQVLVAALFCLTAWRAFYSAFRAWSNLM